MFENIKKDYINHNKEFLNVGFFAMVVYRFGRWRYGIKNKIIRKPLSFVYKLLYFNIKNHGIELPCEVILGGNFQIHHNGGIMVSGYTQFGNNCIIRNGVTIGAARIDKVEAPTIGNNVNIGTGAKILGGIVIGNNVDIGANAVVLKDIPNNCIAVGIPARIIKKDKY
ncbi:serine acetyltransferase [Psychrilyobacter sp.]|uniref:serine O-acetyltransferase n=1 Tax=Psychrilyobacter sp. TaxID=2586924 RepID=UPI0030171CE8